MLPIGFWLPDGLPDHPFDLNLIPTIRHSEALSILVDVSIILGVTYFSNNLFLLQVGYIEFDRIEILDEERGLIDFFYIIPRFDEPLEDWREGEDISGVVRICLFLEDVCILGDGEGWGGRSD